MAYAEEREVKVSYVHNLLAVCFVVHNFDQCIYFALGGKAEVLESIACFLKLTSGITYYALCRLTGRGTVEFTIERGDGSTFFPTTGGEPKSLATVQVCLS